MMRLFSTAALSLALVATGGLFMPGAALAQKKGKEEAPAAAQPAKIQATQNFFKVAKPLQDLLAAKNFDGALGMMPQAEAAATTPDDRYFVGNFWLNIGIGKQDQVTQLKGVEMMLDSGKVAAADRAKIELAAGGLSLNLKNPEGARKHYVAAMAAGADTADTEALLAETYFGVAYSQIEGNGFSAAGRAVAIEGLPHLRKAIDASGRPIDLEVDGGINAETAALAIAAGADVLVAGTATFQGGAAAYAANIARVRTARAAA